MADGVNPFAKLSASKPPVEVPAIKLTSLRKFESPAALVNF